MPKTAYEEDVRDAVIALLQDITTANGYNYTVASIEKEWIVFARMADSDLPGLFVTNEAEDADLEKANTDDVNCKFDQDISIVIVGGLRGEDAEQWTSIANYLIRDVKRAIRKDLTLGGLVDEGVSWTVRRPEPWAARLKNAQFQIVVTYRGRVTY